MNQQLSKINNLDFLVIVAFIAYVVYFMNKVPFKTIFSISLHGRLNISSYLKKWLYLHIFMLGLIFITVRFFLLAVVTDNNNLAYFVLTAAALPMLWSILKMIALDAQRLHDHAWSALALPLIYLISILSYASLYYARGMLEFLTLGFLAYYPFFIKKGTPGPNKYGENTAIVESEEQ